MSMADVAIAHPVGQEAAKIQTQDTFSPVASESFGETVGGACCSDDLLRDIRARFIRASYAFERDTVAFGLEIDGSTGTDAVGVVAWLMEACVTFTSTPRVTVTLLLCFALRRLLTHASVTTASRQKRTPTPTPMPTQSQTDALDASCFVCASSFVCTP